MKKESSKAKTREQIAMEYGICTRTLRRLLLSQKIILPKHLIYPKEQKRIYNAFGNPNYGANN